MRLCKLLWPLCDNTQRSNKCYVYVNVNFIGPIYTGDGSSVQTDHPSRRTIRLE